MTNLPPRATSCANWSFVIDSIPLICIFLAPCLGRSLRRHRHRGTMQKGGRYYGGSRISTLCVEQLVELAFLVFVEDAQDPGLAIAEHVAVIHTEIVEDDGHFLGLFGGQA